MNLKNSEITILKLLIVCVLIFILTLSLNYYINYNYSKTLNNFYSYFSNCNFKEAKNVLNNNDSLLTFKKSSAKRDISSYFTSIIANLCDDLKTKEITSSQAVAVFKEMKDYNLINPALDKLIITLDPNYTLSDESSFQIFLDLAIEKYNNGLFSDALSMLFQIPYSETKYYELAQTYIDKCKTSYKKDLFNEADKLVDEDYYTKAIELLSNIDTFIISSNDSDITDKISSIEIARNDYLNSLDTDNNQSASTSQLENINFDTIHTLSIDSSTPYLIYVNLASQKTYIYEGSTNDWTLKKSFDCSTGIEGKETPTGVYTVTDRGDWFFANEFQQGGKYWVQFLGDYLFHSLPFDETQSEILDYTLGVPASHGCIRLKVDEAKWLYDNVPDDTKVIIN